MIRWEGTTVTTTGISHGGETLGQIQYLRRERILTPTGTLDIPLISGNATRGRLRDTAAALWWEDAAQPPLTLPAAHAIFSGGALTKTVGEPLSGAKLEQVKRLCPPLAVFGAAGGGRIVDGALAVGKMIPICTETLHLLPDTCPHPDTVPDMWDITHIEWYTHRPATGGPATPPAADDDSAPARYGIETFIPGTMFYWWLTMNQATPRTASFFVDALDAYMGDAVVGGNVRIGLGRHRPTLTVTRGALPPAGIWRRDGTPLNVTELETLAWIG